MKVKFKRFSSCVHIPQKVTIGSACYNLFAAKTVLLEPNAMRSLETDIGFCFSKKYAAKIYIPDRAYLYTLPLLEEGGMIYSDFRGNIHVILSSFSSSRVEINVGDRIGQVLFQRKEEPNFVEVSNFDDFPVLDLLLFSAKKVQKRCRK